MNKNMVILYILFQVMFFYAVEYSNVVLVSNGFNHIEKHQVNLFEVSAHEITQTESDTDDAFTLNYKGENLIRRAEIIFFGSLTFSTFLGWLVFSAYNSIMYEDTFGMLRRYQFISLYLGGSVLSLSVSLSDLFLRLRPLMKKVVL